MNVVFIVGDWMCRTVQAKERGWELSPDLSDEGISTSCALDSGRGRDVSSFSKWTTESEGRAGSTETEKSCKGSDPTEENRETRVGCTVGANIFRKALKDLQSKTQRYCRG